MRAADTTPLRRWPWRVATLALGLALLVAALDNAVTAVRGGPVTPPPAPCPQGRTVPILPSPRISQDRASEARYNSVPPTSGPRFAFAVAPGVYPDPLPPPAAVAVLAIGHVVIRYADGTTGGTADELRRLARRHADSVVLAPDPGLETGIALTSWGCLDLLSTMDDQRISRFVRLNNDRTVDRPE